MPRAPSTFETRSGRILLKNCPYSSDLCQLHQDIRDFTGFNKRTVTFEIPVEGRSGAVPAYVNEFWTSRQRAAHSLHEISYRACFKPQLPRFFIELLTRPGDVVYDPFMGRGTTVLETALRHRIAIGCDLNPISRILVRPRLSPPDLERVAERLSEINLSARVPIRDDLLVFYHRETLEEICALREYLRRRESSGERDRVDDWIRMVAINRLSGHSPGFFSVYSLPPNQAASIASQQRINTRLNQLPPRRDIREIILKKTRSLFRDPPYGNESDLFPSELPDLGNLQHAGGSAHRVLTGSADATPELEDGSVNLVVTSPPFLDIVDYAGDNWLRGWFCGLDTKDLDLAVFRKLDAWSNFMSRVFLEISRILVPGGFLAFEVGEIRKGSIRLEETVLRLGTVAGLDAILVLINDQKFSKTAHCWGVDNRAKGTNTNRIVLFRKSVRS